MEDKDGNKRYTTEVVAEAVSVILLGGMGGRSEAPPPADADASTSAGPVPVPRTTRTAAAAAAPADAPNQEISDEDVPF